MHAPRIQGRCGFLLTERIIGKVAIFLCAHQIRIGVAHSLHTLYNISAKFVFMNVLLFHLKNTYCGMQDSNLEENVHAVTLIEPLISHPRMQIDM